MNKFSSHLNKKNKKKTINYLNKKEIIIKQLKQNNFKFKHYKIIWSTFKQSHRLINHGNNNNLLCNH